VICLRHLIEDILEIGRKRRHPSILAHSGLEKKGMLRR
jgi:hypothetical protein